MKTIEITKCLIDSEIEGKFISTYHMAVPLDYAGEISSKFECLGVGRIHSCGGRPYNGNKRFRFYTAFKKIKRFL